MNLPLEIAQELHSQSASSLCEDSHLRGYEV